MKLLAIDGNSVINRAFYGIKLLTTKDGQYTNGIYGFVNILNKLIELENPDAVAVAFDLRSPTFRHKKYAAYKAGRKGMPDELAAQLPILKQLLTAFGYSCLEVESYEADDILGTLSLLGEQSGNECVIATGDRDSLQLVSDKTKVLLATTKMGRPDVTSYGPEEIMEKYQVSPKGLIEIKALQGDASDNIPGVAGIGEKTAGDLISRFANIDYIYDNLDTLDIKEGVRAKLAAGRDNAFLSRELGTIYRTVPINSDYESYKIAPRDDNSLAGLLCKLEFFKLAEKMGLTNIAVKPDESEAQKPLTITADSLELIAKIKSSGTCDCVLSADKNQLCIKAKTIVGSLSFSDNVVDIKQLLCDEKIRKRVHNSKELFRWCIKNNIDVKGIDFDTQLAAYLLNPSSNNYDTDRLVNEYAINVPLLEAENAALAAAHSAVCDCLERNIESAGQSSLLTDIEIPLAKVLAGMELEGFLVDTAGITEYGNQLSERINELQKFVWNEVGYEFNLNSPKQLGEALFVKLGLPSKKKTKSGFSTNAEVLEGLKFEHPAVEHLLEYRQLTKLKSTYCDGLTHSVDADGRIRSTLNQTETRTGRISSTEPNLQNIPVRRAEGRQLRKYFKAKDGYVLCDADYSQIELRVLAHIANDTQMIDAFKNDVDIHTLTASEVFDMPIDMVTPLMRSRAKAVNFGIVYGIGAFSLSKDIGVTRAEADKYIKEYLNTYAQVKEYMVNVVEDAKRDGHVTTIFGRRRLLPELRGSNGIMRAFGERVARNMPIQGAAADIIKIAMIKVSNRLLKELPQAHIIMQVHDELIIEAPESKSELASKIVKEEMENAANLRVPLIADVHCGKTWFEAKE
ncbi:MAG: DNA polymerase I [Oscillospiraceae bacterium]|nr:DNA polymerase I [Oscillospiraceae bacterium]